MGSWSIYRDLLCGLLERVLLGWYFPKDEKSPFAEFNFYLEFSVERNLWLVLQQISCETCLCSWFRV